MAKLYNLARMSTATTGTGTITLGSAVTGFLSFASAGIADGETVTYAISDGSGAEIGRGVYTASGTTLTRSVLKSTNGGSTLNLSGTAQVFITPSAEDIIEPPSSAVDNAAVRFDSTTGRVVQSSALIIADTTGAISRSGNGGIPVQATNTNDNAASGYMGEYASSTLASGSAISLTNNTFANVTSLSLGAGDWMVGQLIIFTGTGSPSDCTQFTGSVSETSATVDDNTRLDLNIVINLGTSAQGCPCPVLRKSLSATTTVYATARARFTTGGVTAYGTIYAWRIR